MKFRRAALSVAAGICFWSGCATAGSDTSANAQQKLLSEDQKTISQAQSDYRQAVLNHGASSDDAKSAMDHLDSAQNKYRVDQQRVQQAQSIHFSSATTSGASGTSVSKP